MIQSAISFAFEDDPEVWCWNSPELIAKNLPDLITETDLDPKTNVSFHGDLAKGLFDWPDWVPRVPDK